MGSKKSSKAVRKPIENAPLHDFLSTDITCNVNTSIATSTISVAAGSTVSFKLDKGKKIYHPGPAAIYLGKAPKKAKDWDGQGKAWFKVRPRRRVITGALTMAQIAEWGATFEPFQFKSYGKDTFKATIPADISSGEVCTIVVDGLAQHSFMHDAVFNSGRAYWAAYPWCPRVLRRLCTD